MELVFVATPTSTVKTQKMLNEAIKGMNATNSIEYSASNIKLIQQ